MNICRAENDYGHVCGLPAHSLEEMAHECRILNDDGSECYRQWEESSEVPHE